MHCGLFCSAFRGLIFLWSAANKYRVLSTCVVQQTWTCISGDHGAREGPPEQEDDAGILQLDDQGGHVILLVGHDILQEDGAAFLILALNDCFVL